MKDKNKTKEQLIKELVALRQQLTELEISETDGKQTERLFEVLANSSTVGIYIVQDGKFRFTNSMFQKYMSYSEEELQGMNSLSLVFPEDRDMVRQNAVDMLKGKHNLPYEFRYISKEGEVKWVMEAVASVQYEGRRASIGSFMDITERKRVEEKYRQLLEDINDGYAVIQNGNVVFANGRFGDIFGYESEQVIGMPLTRFLTPDDRQAMMELYERMMSGEDVPVERIERVAVKEDGTIIIVETNGKVIQYESKPAFCVIVRDITERKQIEEALRHSEEYFRSLIGNLSDVVLVMDVDGNINFLGPSVERVLGYEPEERIGKSGFDLIHPDDFPSVIDSFGKVILKRGYHESMEMRVLHKDGSWRSIEGRARNLLYHPSVAGIVVSFRDITERKRAEEALEMRNRELAILNKIIQSVNQSVRLDQVLQSALENLLEVLYLDGGSIHLLDEATGDLILAAHRGHKDEFVTAIGRVPVDRIQIITNVMETGRALFVSNLLEDERVDVSFKETIGLDNLLVFISVSLHARGKSMGVLNMASRSSRDISSDDLELLETIGGQIGVAIENALLFEKVKEQSVTDELTGLYNRRHFYEVLESEIYRTERYGQPFSLVMLDLDGFKGYNDRLGHINGDNILKSLAQIFKSELRKIDISFRYGGDEFAIILPATESGRAKGITERIRSKWLNMPEMAYPFLEDPLGFSAGIAQFPDDAKTAGDLIFMVDAALYNSKRQGGYQSTLVSELGAIFVEVISTATLDQIYAMAATVDARDPYTQGHSKRVADISEEIGKAIGLSEDEMANLRSASLLHDIGKICVPSSILAKPAELTEPEWRLIKKHPDEGAKIVGYMDGLADLLPIIRHHHEWYNGMGYPDGIKGDNIPIAARIIHVADAYDTMTTLRSYRDVISQEEAFEKLRQCSGTQFDPKVVEILCRTTLETAN